MPMKHLQFRDDIIVKIDNWFRPKSFSAGLLSQTGIPEIPATEKEMLTKAKKKLDKFFGLNIIRNAVSQYGMIQTKPTNLVQTAKKLIKKGGV